MDAEALQEGLLGYSARLEVAYNDPVQPGAFSGAMESMMAKIGHGCVDAGVTLIGHIKGMAEAGEQGFLAMSVTKNDASVNVKGGIEGVVSRVEITLNVIVYGLEEATVDDIVRGTIPQLGDAHVHLLNASDGEFECVDTECSCHDHEHHH